MESIANTEVMETFMNWVDEFMFQLVLIFIAYLLMVIAVESLQRISSTSRPFARPQRLF